MNNLIRPVFRIGMTATEVVAEIVRANPGITMLSFYVYVPKRNIGELASSKGENLSLKDLLFHRPSEPTLTLERKKITAVNLAEVIRTLQVFDRDSVAAVMSETRIKRRAFHIPMMDFACPEQPENLYKIEQLLELIGQKAGVILSSGRSYHYYGAVLMSQAEWFNFLGDCILSRLADWRYGGHRCKDFGGTLRLSACPLRPKIPSVVSVIE